MTPTQFSPRHTPESHLSSHSPHTPTFGKLPDELAWLTLAESLTDSGGSSESKRSLKNLALIRPRATHVTDEEPIYSLLHRCAKGYSPTLRGDLKERINSFKGDEAKQPHR